MGLGLGLLVAGGFAVVGTAAYLIADGMSKAEQRRQEKLTSQHNKNMDDLRTRRSSYHDDFNRSRQDLANRYDSNYLATLEAAREEQRELLRKAWQSIKKELDVQVKEREQRQKQIKETINELYQLMNDNEQMLRKENLKYLALQLEETNEKITAYLRYLKAYEKAQEFRIKSAADELLPIFEFRLPNGYPYRGEVRTYTKENLLRENFEESIVDGLFPIKFYVDDLDVLGKFEDDVEVPVFIEKFITSPHYHYVLSISKGLFMRHVSFAAGVGLEAEVTRHERNYIELQYENLVLRLNKENLENPRLLPPRTSKIRVFPKEWTYFLTKPPIVSEKYQDSLARMHFDNIPMCFTSEAYHRVFKPEFEKRELRAALGDWRIAPMDEKDLNNPFYRFQLSNEFIIKAEFVQQDSIFYFAFREFLDESFQCTPTEVHISVSATMLACNEHDIVSIPDQSKKTMEDLALYCEREFIRQKQVKEANGGILFYNKWVMLTDELITYKYKGKHSLQIDISNATAPEKDRYSQFMQVTVEIANVEETLKFIEDSTKDAYRTYYFIEDENGDYYAAHLTASGEKMFVYGKIDLQNYSSIMLYVKEIPYPEIQQLNALNAFRDGKTTNDIIRQALLDGAYIEPNTREFPIVSFYNPDIERNAHQYDSVVRALEEENLFLIQGPPGTGKTTVIQEIVLQYLTKYPTKRVLIVSQANVAVDNVLVDLYEGQNPILSKDRIIRCGRKVDDDLLEIGFDEKYKAYITEVKEISKSIDNKSLADRWLQIIGASKNIHNTQVSELILKSHQVIGATCVGLAKRNLGLDLLTFDLVIIDEASKALPGELLIPINRAKKCIIIGDHRQLPPTIDSALLDQEKIDYEDRDFIKEELFSKSLFEHLYLKTPASNKSMLTTQYRMPPVLGTLISTQFYEGKVENGEPTYTKKPVVFNEHLNWLDLSNTKEYKETVENKRSPYNLYEADLVIEIVLKIRNISNSRIAIITPYKGQKSRIYKAFCKQGIYKPSELNIVFNTIDAFQGDEAEIVIFCTTRSTQPTDFFSDDARINVALSRCKNELLIIGSRNYFKKFGNDSKLNAICDYIEQHGIIYNESELRAFLNAKQDNSMSEVIVNPQVQKKEETKLTPKNSLIDPEIKVQSYKQSTSIKQKRVGVARKNMKDEEDNNLETDYSKQELIEAMNDYYNAMEDYRDAMDDYDNAMEDNYVSVDDYDLYNSENIGLSINVIGTNIANITKNKNIISYDTNKNSSKDMVSSKKSDATTGNIIVRDGENAKIYNTVTGDIIIYGGGHLKLYGNVTGNITIHSGGHLKLYGNGTGNIIIHGGGKLKLYGAIFGNVTVQNSGYLKLYGTVSGDINAQKGGNIIYIS